MEITQSEDCLIFNGFTPEITKMSRVNDTILEFMKNKQTIDSSDRFNFIIFQKDGPSYLDHFTFDPNIILKTLKSLEKKAVRANIAGGIFVAITFIIEVFKRISEKVFRLIILADNGSCKIPIHYIPVLEDLVDKVKGMPFIIDVIRINDTDMEQKNNLINLVKRTNGKFYDLNDIKEFSSTLLSLSKKKYIKIPEYYMKKKKITIQKGNIPFYVNLADDPLIVDNIESCAICFERDNRGMMRCPSCEIVVHKKCWAKWAKVTNIGISYVFRCRNCYNLIRLDEKYVLDIQEGRIPTEEKVIKLSRRDMVKYFRELEDKEKPKIIQVSDPMVIEVDNSENKTKNIEKMIRRRIEKRIKVVICPNCSKITTSINRICPSCSFPLS